MGREEERRGVFVARRVGGGRRLRGGSECRNERSGASLGGEVGCANLRVGIACRVRNLCTCPINSLENVEGSLRAQLEAISISPRINDLALDAPST